MPMQTPLQISPALAPAFLPEGKHAFVTGFFPFCRIEAAKLSPLDLGENTSLVNQIRA